MLPNEGKKKMIESYLNNNDVYLGIWSHTIYNYTNILTLTDINNFEITNHLGYKRQIILAGGWTLFDAVNLIYQTTDFINFDIEEDWDSLTGFFLATTEDNSGTLLSLVKFNEILNIDISNASEIAAIQPTIKLL